MTTNPQLVVTPQGVTDPASPDFNPLHQVVHRLHGAESSDALDGDGWPKDWKQPIQWRGISHNVTNRRYLVRVGANSRQYSIAAVCSQHYGASLYDLALWKLCPKLGRRIKPNFPESFDEICQLDVDEQCPRLNSLFAELPWLSMADESLGEAGVRARILNLNPLPSIQQRDRTNRQFLDCMYNRKKFRALIETELIHSESERSTLAMIHKLPAIVELFQSLEESLRESAGLSKQLEELMEKSATYYSKLVAESESLGA